MPTAATTTARYSLRRQTLPKKTEIGVPTYIVTSDVAGMSVLLRGLKSDTEPTVYSFIPPSFSQSHMLTQAEPGLAYNIMQPIPVVIEENDDHFIASFGEANIHSSGETASEALDNLKSYIGDIFEELLIIGRERLGPDPARELTVLQRYIQERANAE